MSRASPAQSRMEAEGSIRAWEGGRGVALLGLRLAPRPWERQPGSVSEGWWWWRWGVLAVSGGANAAEGVKDSHASRARPGQLGDQS